MALSRRRFLSYGLGTLAASSTLPLLASPVSLSANTSIPSKTLTLALHSSGIYYPNGSATLKPGSKVAFSNPQLLPLYLQGLDGKPCPFTEGWPQCIPAGQTVVRVIAPNTPTADFAFQALPLGYQGNWQHYSSAAADNSGLIRIHTDI